MRRAVETSVAGRMPRRWTGRLAAGLLPGLLLVLLAAPPVWAQVAVPELVPAAPRLYGVTTPVFARSSVTPPNPAAMQWGAPSRIGGGWLEGDSEDTRPALGTSDKLRGQFGGVRWVGETVSLGLEVLNVDTDYPNSSIEEGGGAAAFAFAPLDNLAIGVSAEASEREETGAIPDRRLDLSGRALGASWRIGETLFLGGAVGRDYLDVQDLETAGSPTLKTDRGYTMLGIGLRGGGGMVWHLEYDVIDRRNFRDRFGNSIFRGYTLQQGAVEVGFWGLLFGYASYRADVERPPALGDMDISGFTLDGGILPLPGISIMGRLERTDVEVAGVKTTDEDVVSAMLTWQF